MAELPGAASTPPLAPPPETTFGYWQRKNDELALLREHLGLGPGPAVVTVPDLVREKLALRSALLIRFVEEHPLLTESNLGPEAALALDGARVGFTYQRYDTKVHRRPFAPWFYPALGSADLGSLGFLTASGMSSVSAALTALDLMHSEARPLYMAPGTYFETRQYAREYLRHLHTEIELPGVLANCGVLLLDSICAGNPLAWLAGRPLAGLCAVLLDTTCYDVSAPEIVRLVERCRVEGVPCVLLRSHVKIDSLGLEYGRLGSIVIIVPRPCDGWRGRFVQALRRRLGDFLYKVGAGFSLSSYFPLTTNPGCRRLNQRRNELASEFNLRCAVTLSRILQRRSAVRVGAYHHGRFFFLRLPAGAGSTPGEVPALGNALLEAGVFARPAPSFGYDFAAVTQMIEPQHPGGLSLRLSLPDYPADLLDPCIEAIARFAIELAPLQ